MGSAGHRRGTCHGLLPSVVTLGCALLSFLAIGVGPGAAVSTAAACDAIDAAVPADRAGWAVAGLPANVSHAARKHALTMTAAANGGPARSTLPQRVPASNLDVSIILDTASAMPAKAIAAGEATAAGLLETLPPDARVSLVTAGGKPMLVSRGRGESAKTVSTIRTLRRRPGHALYDAMLLAAQSMSRDAARADVVVVIAGGPDDTSFSSLDAASAALARQGALLHVLDVGHQPAMPSLGPQCPSSDVTAPLTTAAATKLGSGLADQVTGLYWIPVPGASADGYLSLHAAAGHQSATGKFGVKPAPIASPAQSSDSLPIGPGILLAAIGVGAMAFGGVVLVMGLAADREGGGRIRRPRLPRRAHHAPAPPVPVRHAAAGRPLARRRTDEVLTLPVAAPAAAREARRPATARVAMPRRVVASAAAPPRPVLHAATGRAVFSAAPAPVPEAAATGPAVVQPVPAPTAPAPTAPASAAAAAVRPAAVRPAQVAPLTVPPQPPGRRRVRTPRVRVPRLPVPHLRMPHVRLPHVRLPHVRLPHVRLPHVRLPHVRASRPRTPQVTTMPRVSMPAVRLHLPRLHLPRPHLPRLHAPHLHLPQLRVLHARRRSGRLRHRRAPVGPLTARLVRVLGVALLPLLVGVRTVMNPQWWAGVRDDPADIALIAVALVLVALGLRRLWVATSEPDAVDLRRLQRMSRLEDADEKVLSYTRTVVFSVSAPPAASPAPAAVAADAAGATSAPAPIGVAETPLPEPATEAPPEMAGVPLSEPATEPLPEPVVAADVRPVAFHVRQAPPVSPHRARRRRVPRFPTLPSLFLLAPAAVLLFML